MALPPPIPRQHQQQQHARQLSRLNMNIPGASAQFADPPPFTPHGHPKYAQFSQTAQPGPQSAFTFAGNHMQHQQHQQRQLGHGSQPSMAMHRSRPSLASIPGFMPGGPMTAGPHMANFNPFPVPPTPGSQQQFPGQLHPPQFRPRRNQSISIGGPPKAALGGPQRKAVMPTPSAGPAPAITDVKQKKIVVKLPKETTDGNESGRDNASVASTSQPRSVWSRRPLPLDAVPPPSDFPPLEASSSEIYPSRELDEGDRSESVTVALPRRNAWDAYRSDIMEEKLAKLGVEPSGFMGNPIGHLPGHVMMHHHNRASSVSTPADPALLVRHSMSGNRQTPSPLGVPHPMSALSTPAGPGFPPPQQQRSLAPPFSLGGPGQPSSLSPLPQRFGPPPSLAARSGFHGHSMSLATPSYNQPNPYLSPSFGLGSTNPFGNTAVLGGDSSQGPSLSVSPQPGTSLASVSEYDEGDEEGEGDESAETGPKIHAPKPRGILHLRPVFVSHQSSPAPSSAADIRETGEGELITPPVTAVAPAKTLSTMDFARGFGIESEEEEEELRAENPVEQPTKVPAPIVDEVQRDRLIAEEVVAVPTPTASRFPTDAISEGEIIEEAINAVDPAEDADEEDASSSDHDVGEDVVTEAEEEGTPDDVDNFTTPSHSRHVSKVSMAPSLAEMGGASHGTGMGGARGMKEFRFGGAARPQHDDLVREEEGEDAESVSGPAGRQVVYLNDEMGNAERDDEQEWTGTDDFVDRAAGGRLVSDDDSVGEWSNPSDEERAREERRILREQNQHQSRRLSHYEQDNTLHSQQSFISNPSNEGRRSEDIVSNPSDDDYGQSRDGDGYGGGGMTFGGNILAQAQRARGHSDPFYIQPGAPVVDFSPAVQRPLPPLPHSREQPGQIASPSALSNHQSPAPSTQTTTPLIKGHRSMLSTASAARSDLNPLARPFVFGARPGSNSFSLQSPSTEPGSVPPTAHGRPSHSRQASLASRLNIAAPEFKPTGAFTFTPISGVPTLPFPAPPPTTRTPPRPLPQLPTSDSPFPAQGREKRQRVVSEDETTNIPRLGFQFPQQTSSQSVQKDAAMDDKQREAAPSMDRRGSVLNINAKPFTFTGAALATLQVSAPSVEPLRSLSYPGPSQAKSEMHSPVCAASPPLDKAVSMPASAVASPPPGQVVDSPHDVTSAFGRPAARLPIPDFSHPVSANTVPAGLFKALQGDGDGPTRSTVRSRLGSRDFFEHANRRSLDDLNVPSISKQMAPKATGTLPVPEPAHILPKPGVPLLTLAPPPRAKERRSSAPSQPVEVRESSPHEPSPVETVDSMLSSVTHRRDELDHLESRIEEIIDDKMSQIREDISSLADVQGQASDSVVNAAIGQLVASFRTQMMDYMKKVTETNMSRADAHVELDFDLIKAAIDEGHQNIRATIQRDIAALAERMQTQPVARPLPPMEVLHAIEDLRTAVTETMNAATQTMLSHADDGHAQRRAQEERALLIRDLSSLLLPSLSALRQEPLDLDFMTRELSEAVKPHISQLIDLASDKKETAVLIVQHLGPLLHSLVPPRLDIGAMASQLAMDVVRLAPPTDPHVLKEQVADLVIERLDSRLAIRDGTLNPEAIATRVAKIVGPLADLANLPTATSVETLNERQDALLGQSADLLGRQTQVLSKLDAIPESITTVTNLLKEAHDNLVTKTALLDGFEELKRLASTNVELQTHLAKARGAHGQVRSEKDVVSQRLQAAEEERDRMRAELEAVKVATTARETEVAAAEARSAISEATLAQALERLKVLDAGAQTDRERIAAAEQQTREMQTELHTAQTKVKTMELEASFTSRDLEAMTQAKEHIEQEMVTLRSQQQNWDDLRRTADQVETLSRLIGAADSEEVAELKRIRDRSKIMEKEQAALQKRCADQEAKIATLQRTNASTKQTLAQAQQKVAEFEKQVHTLDDELEATHVQLDEARELQGQFEGDIAALKDEVETGVTAMKLAGDREQQLQNKIATLESQLLSVQAELEEAQSSTPAPILAPRPQIAAASWQKGIAVPNGRPGSTPSDASRPGTVTPIGRGSPSSLDTPPTQGLWESIHAPNKYPSVPSSQQPRQFTPKRSYDRAAVASPTASVVSLAATEQEDGWWA